MYFDYSLFSKCKLDCSKLSDACRQQSIPLSLSGPKCKIMKITNPQVAADFVPALCGARYAFDKSQIQLLNIHFSLPTTPNTFAYARKARKE